MSIPALKPGRYEQLAAIVRKHAEKGSREEAIHAAVHEMRNSPPLGDSFSPRRRKPSIRLHPSRCFAPTAPGKPFAEEASSPLVMSSADSKDTFAASLPGNSFFARGVGAEPW